MAGVVLTASSLAGIFVATPALATSPTMVGTVTSVANGDPIAGVEVNAYGGIYAALYGTTTTAANGTYTLALPAGSFWVRFRDPMSIHTTVWYGPAPAMVGSTKVVVPASGSVTADMTMFSNTTLGGTVSTSAGPAPIGSVAVTVVDSSTLATVATTSSTSDGTWATAVPAGSYKVRYDDQNANHPTTWSGGAPSAASATIVSVPAGTHTISNITLDPFASIVGQLTDTASAPLGGIIAYLLEPTWGLIRARATSAVDGSYALPAAGGTYRVRFHDPSSTYSDWYSGGTPSWATSSTVEVPVPGPLTLDVQLLRNPRISGTVTLPGGGAASGIDVTALDASNTTVGTTITAADGTYQFDGVTAGPTRIMFSDPSGVHARTYAGPSNTFAEAQVIDAAIDGMYVVDHTMALAGSLTGSVTIGAFGPAPVDEYVFAVDPDHLQLLGIGLVGPDGSWRIDRLAPGDYKLAYIDSRYLTGPASLAYRPVFSGDRDYLTEGLSDAYLNATAFSVTGGGSTPAGLQRVVGHHCDPTVVVPGADLRTNFPQGLGEPVNLDGCDVHGANLSGTFLVGSLRYADFTDADLSSATVAFSTYVAGDVPPATTFTADMTGAKITGANLHHTWAMADQLLRTNPDWSGADLRAETHKPMGMPGGIELWPVFIGGTSGMPGGLFANPIVLDSTVPFSGSPLVLDGATMTNALFGSMPGVAIHDLTCTNCMFGTYDFMFSGAADVDLTGADLTDLTCTNCMFVEGNLTNVNLTGADLTGADLTGADLAGTQLTGVPLTGTTIAGADLHAAVGLTTAQLASTDPDWSNTDLHGLGLDLDGTVFGSTANLSGAKLYGNSMAGITASGRDISSADLHGVDLTGATLTFADLSYANLSGADLTDANLTGTNLTGADLTGANTTGTIFSTDVSGMDLTGADLTGQDLSGWLFVGTNLTNANLAGANLSGADLTGAVVTGADFGSSTGVTTAQFLSTTNDWTSTKVPPISFAGADLTSRVMYNTTLTGRNLSGANLSGVFVFQAHLSYANLAGANLSGANLTAADLRNTDLTGATLSGATIRSANLKGTTLVTVAQLLSTNHDWTNLQSPSISFAGANFSGGGWVLTGANFSGRNLSNANLSGVNMTGANLSGATLTWANLSNANVTNAFLQSADVRSSVLTSANFTGTHIDAARFSNAWNLTKAQLITTNHSWTNTKLDTMNLDLSAVDFTTGGYQLTGVSFRKVNLSNANLSGRDLSGVNLALANLTNTDFGSSSGSPSPSGGSTATYNATVCPDLVTTNGTTVLTCVGHGFTA